MDYSQANRGSANCRPDIYEEVERSDQDIPDY